MNDQGDGDAVPDNGGDFESGAAHRFWWNLAIGAVLIPLFGAAHTIFRIYYMDWYRGLCGTGTEWGGIVLTVDAYPCEIGYLLFAKNVLFLGLAVSPAPIFIIYLGNFVLALSQSSRARRQGSGAVAATGGTVHLFARFMANIAICAALSVLIGGAINYWLFGMWYATFLLIPGTACLFVALVMYIYIRWRHMAGWWRPRRAD